MSESEVPVTPPRRSRSPSKASPAINSALESEDPFKTKSLFANSPVQGLVAKKMDGTSSPMTSSSESAIASSRINMVSAFNKIFELKNCSGDIFFQLKLLLKVSINIHQTVKGKCDRCSLHFCCCC
jgi:hypothetical protein